MDVTSIYPPDNGYLSRRRSKNDDVLPDPFQQALAHLPDDVLEEMVRPDWIDPLFPGPKARRPHAAPAQDRMSSSRQGAIPEPPTISQTAAPARFRRQAVPE